MEPQQPTQTTTTYTQAQPKPFPVLPVLLSLLALLLLLLTGYLGYQNMQLSKQIAELSKSTPNPTPTPVVDPTANWKTYENTTYQFSIRYPNTGLFTIIEPAQYREFGITIVLPDESVQYVATRIGIQIVGRTKTNAAGTAQSFHRHDSTWMTDPNVPFTPITQASIGNSPASTFSSSVCPPKGINCEKTEYYFTDNGTFVYLITATYPIDEAKNPIHKSATDQILSTFKFLEATTTLKTYTSPKAKNLSYPAFTLTYPSIWSLKQESATDTDVHVTLSKQEYELTIRQAATGGSICRFDDTPMDREDIPMNENYGKDYTELSSNISRMRYTKTSTQDSVNNYSVCMKEQISNYFTRPTQIGGITFKTPIQPDSVSIKEIENILTSLSEVK